jgi:hypothetical protein
VTILVLLFLAVVWAVVLIPSLVRRQAEARPADSIIDFRRQLRVLQRAGPRTVAPAYSLAAQWPTGTVAGGSPARAGGEVTRTLPPHALRRLRTLRRRRDTLLVLVGGVVGSAALGAVPVLRALWALAAGLCVFLAVYVALLIRLRNLEAEREMKLRFLPPPRAQEPTLLLRRPAN